MADNGKGRNGPMKKNLGKKNRMFPMPVLMIVAQAFSCGKDLM